MVVDSVEFYLHVWKVESSIPSRVKPMSLASLTLDIIRIGKDCLVRVRIVWGGVQVRVSVA